MFSLTKQFKSTIKKYRLIAKGDKVLIGVSGGPDSVTLLYLLNGIKKEFHLKINIAHLDHGLRRNSHKDLEFVEDLAKKLKIPLIYKRIELAKAKRMDSLEQMARDLRLDFFIQSAQNIKCNKIALGHNLDDQAETILMRVIRGTGLYGLSGILPKRKIRGAIFIRPLLEIKRADIEKYLKRKNIIPRLDPTNLNTVYFRNRIRNQLIPLLELAYNPKIKEVLSNMAQAVAGDYEYLKNISKKALIGCCIFKKDSISIKLKNFLKYDLAIQKMILRLAIERLVGDTRRLTYKHWQEAYDLIYNRHIGSILDLPRLYITKKRNALRINLR